MNKKQFYTDASCKHKRGIGSWAVVQGDKYWSGIIRGEKLRSGYCELYAIREALKIANNTNAIIYNDNPCVHLLNREEGYIEKKLTKSKHKDKEMLKEVYDLYNSMTNVVICKISRKDNHAHHIARKTIKKAIKMKD